MSDIITEIFRMQNSQSGDVRSMIRCPKCDCPHLPGWKKRKLWGIIDYGKPKPSCGDCGYHGEVEEFVDWTVKEGCLTVIEEKAV